jgi:hypothetical protein
MKLKNSALSILFILSLTLVMTALVVINQKVQGEHILDVTKGNSTVWFGGEKVGTLNIGFEDYGGQATPGGSVNITAEVNLLPTQGKVLEGWLLDPVFNTYNNLSLGQFLNGRLNFNQYMVNPDVYEFFVISEEPIGDPDSRLSNVILGGTRVDLTPDDIVGGAKLNDTTS